MKVQVQAMGINLSPEEVKKMIPQEILNSIQGKGTIQAYTLAHEGKTKPKILESGNHEVLSWPKRVIEKISNVVKTGTDFFLGHGKGTNSHDGRISVGKIIASAVRNIGGKLSNIVIGHFPDNDKVKDLDVISMEADIVTDDRNEVQDVSEISGIAMASSNQESPAFPGAVRLAAIQCFSVESETLEKGEKKMTFEEVKQAIRELNIFPHQLFDEEKLKSDRVFGKLFDDLSAKTVDNERLKKINEELESKSKEAVRKATAMESKTILDRLMADGYTEKQKEFIENRFNPDKIEDLSENGLRTFIENEKEEFSKMAKIFGGDEKQPTGEAVSGETKVSRTGDPVEDQLNSYEE